jgi:hypothetical protein
MHPCLPSSGTRSRGGPARPFPSNHWDTSTMSEHGTTDLFRLYLDEVGRHPLLTKDGTELFHAYGAGVPGPDDRWGCRMRGSTP